MILIIVLIIIFLTLKKTESFEPNINSHAHQIHKNLIKILNSLIEPEPTEIKDVIFETVRTKIREETLPIIKKFITRLNKKGRERFELINIVDFSIQKGKYINSNSITKYIINFFLYNPKRNFEFEIQPTIFKINSRLIITNINLPGREKELITDPKGYPTLQFGEQYAKFSKTGGQFGTHDVIIIPEEIGPIIDKRRSKLETVSFDKPPFRCFGVEKPENITSLDQCIDNLGFWDRPVLNDAECPFYKANKNYGNDRGGLSKDSTGKTSGFCELPKGMQLKGFRNLDADPSKQPYCYNCLNGDYGEKTLGKCCTEQLDKIKYPTLNSPDFMYEGDLEDRYAAREIFKSRGINWYGKPEDKKKFEKK